MYVYEYGEDILLVDCGMGFPEEHMLGVDFVIPDISYLRDKIHRIRGLILTHAHEDHIGGLPYILPQLKVPVYGTKLTIGLIKVKMAEHNLLSQVQLNVLNPDDHLKLGVFDVDAVRVSHSVPDSVAYVIRTPAGATVHTGDFKFDWTPVDGKPTDVSKLVRLTGTGALALMSDCLRSEKPGYTLSERKILDSFEQAMGKAKGKVIITTFSSNISRIQQAIEASRKYGRKVVVAGRSMEQNLLTARELGYISLPPDMIVKQERAGNLRDQELTFIVAGAQGQEGSALWRIANDDHRFIQLRPGDMVVFSADPIPGNQDEVYEVIDKLSQKGAIVYYSDITDNIHVSGHAAQAELLLMMNLVKPKYLVPVSGVYRQLQAYKTLAMDAGHEAKDIFILDEGEVLEMDQAAARPTGRIQTENILVDGLGVGDVGNVVLRDRKVLSEEGMVTIIVTIDKNSGQLIGDPDVVSRGFVYAKENEKIIADMRELAKRALTDRPGRIDWHYAKTKVQDELEKFVFQETQRRPMILPLVVEV
jgi:ribonuclease J